MSDEELFSEDSYEFEFEEDEDGDGDDSAGQFDGSNDEDDQIEQDDMSVVC